MTDQTDQKELTDLVKHYQRRDTFQEILSDIDMHTTTPSVAQLLPVTLNSADFVKSRQANVVEVAKKGGSIYPFTAYECSQKPCFHLKWIWESFHVGLGPQPMNLDIICSLRGFDMLEFFQLHKIKTGKCDGSCMMLDPSTHSQHMTVLKHLVYVWSGHGTILCGAGASNYAP
jgi:hypothetical protein